MKSILQIYTIKCTYFQTHFKVIARTEPFSQKKAVCLNHYSAISMPSIEAESHVASREGSC